MLNLKAVTWGTFRIGEVFTIENCKCSKVSALKDGDVPYIGATANNNGVLRFVERKESLITKGNCIVFICDGEGSIGLSIYKSEDFIGTTTVKVGRSKHINKYTAMFITTVADTVRGKYNFGYKRNEKNLKRETINLPITTDGAPDWSFMEEYMKQVERQLLKPTIDKLCKRLITNELIGGGKSLHSNWKAFYFTEVFTEIQRGKRLKKADHKVGDTPYVSSTSFNNGVDGFIGNDGSVRRFEDCLTLANSGSVGCAFYHRYEFIASDHVTQLKKEGLDKYAYLFMIPLINRLSEKYSFNREINDERIKREKLLLPVTDTGEIDFQFMSSFMKQMETDILGTALSTFQKRLIDNQLNINKLGGVNWGKFFIEDIAEIISGKDIYERERVEGVNPYITATSNQNGIGYFVGNTNATLESECLSVNRNGSVGYCFYHSYKALYGNDTRKLRPKVKNKYVSLFISMCITNQREKYGYGYKMGTGRLKRQRILLPVNNIGQPDWEFMEEYMRQIESRKILDYLYNKFI